MRDLPIRRRMVKEHQFSRLQLSAKFGCREMIEVITSIALREMNPASIRISCIGKSIRLLIAHMVLIG